MTLYLPSAILPGKSDWVANASDVLLLSATLNLLLPILNSPLGVEEKDQPVAPVKKSGFARILTPSGSGTYWADSGSYGTVKIARRITGDGTSTDASTGDSQYNRIPLTVSSLENNGDWDLRGYVNIPYPLTSSYKYIEFMVLAGCPDDSALMTYSTGAANLYKNDNLTAIQFLPETGTISAGTFKLYGIAK